MRQWSKFLAWITLFLALLIAVVFLGQFTGIASAWASLIALLSWGVILRFTHLRRATLTVCSIGLLAVTGYIFQRPSHERNWNPEIARLPHFEFDQNQLRAANLRDFTWNSSHSFEENWVEGSYDLNKLKGVNVIVVPFGDSELAAHVMLSFQFEEAKHLAVSVETRPEIGESYSLIGGAARQLELIYLFGSERDLLGLRILHRCNRVYSLPLKIEKQFAKELLLELCIAANQLQEEPRFYATLRHNCTTTLLRHVNRIETTSIGLSKEIIFPAQLGRHLHSLGYLDTDLDWPKVQERYRIDQTISKLEDLKSFSQN